jgi:hypothetical protein
MRDVTADVVHRAPEDGLGSMGTAAVFQLGLASVKARIKIKATGHC